MFGLRHDGFKAWLKDQLDASVDGALSTVIIGANWGDFTISRCSQLFGRHTFSDHDPQN
jgi:hypothetical protein